MKRFFMLLFLLLPACFRSAAVEYRLLEQYQ